MQNSQQLPSLQALAEQQILQRMGGRHVPLWPLLAVAPLIVPVYIAGKIFRTGQEALHPLAIYGVLVVGFFVLVYTLWAQVKLRRNSRDYVEAVYNLAAAERYCRRKGEPNERIKNDTEALAAFQEALRWVKEPQP